MTNPVLVSKVALLAVVLGLPVDTFAQSGSPEDG